MNTRNRSGLQPTVKTKDVRLFQFPTTIKKTWRILLLKLTKSETLRSSVQFHTHTNQPIQKQRFGAQIDPVNLPFQKKLTKRMLTRGWGEADAPHSVCSKECGVATARIELRLPNGT